MSTNSQSTSSGSGQDLAHGSIDDEFHAFMEDFFTEKAKLKDEDEALKKEEEENASYQQAAAAFFARRSANTAEKRSKLNDKFSEHAQRHNIIVVPQQIEPPQQQTDTPTSNSTQPAPAIQPPLSDEEYDKRKALSRLLDNYAGKPDNERPEVSHVCEDAGITFQNLDDLRQQLWMEKGAKLTYHSVRQAINTQLIWRYMSEEEREAAAAANAQSAQPKVMHTPSGGLKKVGSFLLNGPSHTQSDTQ